MKVVFYVIVIVAFALNCIAAMCAPNALASNGFLAGFVNHEIVSLLAVILTVTAASAANLHLAFNRAEEASGQIGHFEAARREINNSAYWLVWIFIATVVMLVLRSFFLDSPTALSFFNGLALWFLLINVLVLVDLTSAVFEIQPLLAQSPSTTEHHNSDRIGDGSSQ